MSRDKLTEILEEFLKSRKKTMVEIDAFTITYDYAQARSAILAWIKEEIGKCKYKGIKVKEHQIFNQCREEILKRLEE
jgi:hypothetical protein